MSRSNPYDKLENPAKVFYEWNSDNGCFKYYDKVEKKNVLVPLSAKTPFTFLFLDAKSTIKGFCEAEQGGFWSNEVTDTTKEVLTVRTKAGIHAVGLYADIKDKLKAKGAKYCQSVYIAIKGENGLQIANIQMLGAALNEWIEFVKNNNINEIAVQIKSVEEKKKGKTIYNVPIFTPIKVSAKTNEEAVALDKELQEYLSAYFAKNSSAPLEKETVADEPLPTLAQQKVATKEPELTKQQFEDSLEDSDPPF